jgi:hypothetical protein
MTDQKELSKTAPGEIQERPRPRWETPTIEVLPLAMTRNSVSGPSDGPHSYLS